jgi:Sulfotransferase family
MSRSPVFIVGSPRSGTSVLVDALISVGYLGFREGNLLGLMQVIDNIIDHHFKGTGVQNPKVMASQVNPKILKSRIEDIFREITNELNTGPLWFDKTGSAAMIQAIPTLRRFWPECVFIFAKRRAIENLVSRQKKFPARTFEDHCSDWAKTMSSWRAARQQLPRGDHIEVDQQVLLQNTSAISEQIADFLKLEKGQTENLIQTFRTTRPQETAVGSATGILSLDSLSWSESQREAFKKYCAPEMEAYGYSTDEKYWRRPATANAR